MSGQEKQTQAQKKQEQQKMEQQKQYNDYVKQVTPTHNLPLNMAKAFVTGGSICTIGQFILNFCERQGIEKDISSGRTYKK